MGGHRQELDFVVRCRDAYFLACGVQVDGVFALQRRRAAVVIANLALIKLRDEFKQAATCRIKMRGEFEDSIADSADCFSADWVHQRDAG